MMKVFGRNDLREVICERDTKPSVVQVMDLVSGDTIQHQMTAKGGTAGRMARGSEALTDRQITERIYLTALTRRPSETEVTASPRSIEGEAVRSARRAGKRSRMFSGPFSIRRNFLFDH